MMVRYGSGYLKFEDGGRHHELSSRNLVTPGPWIIFCSRRPDSMAGVRGLELANVGLIECRPNPLVCQNIFVPETFAEEPQKDGRGSRCSCGTTG